MALRAIYYDTETTGVSSEKDRVIELAAYDILNDTSFVELINPGMPIPPSASAIHHITDEMVQNAPSFAEVGQKFIEFCQGEVVLIAHNNDAFDLLFLKNEYARHSMVMPEWKFLDTLKWARRYRPDLPKHSLQFLREVYGIAANNAHRALEDVKVLYKVFNQMTDDLSIDTIYALLCKPRLLQHMPFGKHQGKPLAEVPRDYLKWMKENGAFEKHENKDLLTAFSKLGMI